MNKDQIEKNREKFDLIKNSLETLGCRVFFENYEITITSNNKNISKIILFLKDNPTTSFDILIDLCAVDYPGRQKRFEII